MHHRWIRSRTFWSNEDVVRWTFSRTNKSHSLIRLHELPTYDQAKKNWDTRLGAAALGELPGELGGFSYWCRAAVAANSLHWLVFRDILEWYSLSVGSGCDVLWWNPRSVQIFVNTVRPILSWSSFWSSTAWLSFMYLICNSVIKHTLGVSTPLQANLSDQAFTARCSA